MHAGITSVSNVKLMIVRLGLRQVILTKKALKALMDGDNFADYQYDCQPGKG